MSTDKKKLSQKQWGDDDDDDDEVNRNVQDANGLVERTKYMVNAKGQKVQVVTKIKVSEIKVRTPRRVELRKNLPRFGDAKVGEENVTLPSKDFIQMEHPEDQLVEDVDDPGMKSTLASFIQRNIETKATRELEGEYLDADYDRSNSRNDVDNEPKSDRYVPPGKLGLGSSGRTSLDRLAEASKSNETTIRVSNLTKNVTEADLHDLFDKFGSVARVTLPKTKPEGKELPQTRGFAYIEYRRRDDAEKAMAKLQGHGYDHLILKLEWAQPSQKDASGGGGNLDQYRSGYGQKLAQDTNEKGVVFASSKRSVFGGN